MSPRAQARCSAWAASRSATSLTRHTRAPWRRWATPSSPINGNVTATNADTVLLNGITVNGNVTLTGGGGEIPWALKNNTVGHNFTVRNVTPEWLGVLFSHIGGNLTLTNITATDPEDDGNAAVSVVVNTIGENLNCEHLGPRLTGGAIPGEFNIVGGKTTGQCIGLLSGF